MLVFEERGKPEFPEKNLSEQSREPTNSTHLTSTFTAQSPTFMSKNINNNVSKDSRDETIIAAVGILLSMIKRPRDREIFSLLS